MSDALPRLFPAFLHFLLQIPIDAQFCSICFPFAFLFNYRFFLLPPSTSTFLSVNLPLYLHGVLLNFLFNRICVHWTLCTLFSSLSFLHLGGSSGNPFNVVVDCFFFHVVLCCSQLFNEFVFISPQACSRNSLKLKINIYNFWYRNLSSEEDLKLHDLFNISC